MTTPYRSRNAVKTLLAVVPLCAYLLSFLSLGTSPVYAADHAQQVDPLPHYIMCLSTYYRLTEMDSMTHRMGSGTYSFKAELIAKVDTRNPSHYCGRSYAQAIVVVPSGGKINRVTIGDDFANNEATRTNVDPGTLVLPTPKTSEPHGNVDLLVLGIAGMSGMNDYLITNT